MLPTCTCGKKVTKTEDCHVPKNNIHDAIIVVQRVLQTVKAHVPRSGENKWNFSVSLHDVNLYPGVNLKFRGPRK